MSPSHDRIRTVLIIGSTREGRFGPTVAAWVAEHARARPDLDVDLLDLAEAGLPAVLQREPDLQVRRFAARIDQADALIVITPEYNHGYPAPLKQAIDWLRDEWAAKPVALVSYGGRSGGLRAVEQLRQVFAEVSAVPLRDTLSFHQAHTQFRPDGTLKDPAPVEAAAATLFDRLEWWARALREARQVRPYAG